MRQAAPPAFRPDFGLGFGGHRFYHRIGPAITQTLVVLFGTDAVGISKYGNMGGRVAKDHRHHAAPVIALGHGGWYVVLVDTEIVNRQAFLRRVEACVDGQHTGLRLGLGHLAAVPRGWAKRCSLDRWLGNRSLRRTE